MTLDPLWGLMTPKNSFQSHLLTIAACLKIACTLLIGLPDLFIC